MAKLHVVESDDPVEALDAGADFLRTAPVEHNLVLTLLTERAARPEPGRYWRVVDGARTAGLALQSPPGADAVLTPMGARAVGALAAAMTETVPSLPGVFGRADTAARFAGRWAEELGVPASPVEGQRLYRLGALRPPPAVAGRARPAGSEDEERVFSWMDGFGRDTGGHGAPRELVRSRILAGRTLLWDDGDPVSMASFTAPVAGVARVGHVYTPPDRRRSGYAAACTAAATEAARQAGARDCVLFTQLGNPQSNAIYRRLGYRAVAEQLRYRFAARPSPHPPAR